MFRSCHFGHEIADAGNRAASQFAPLAQIGKQPPVAYCFSAKRRFGHAMIGNEAFDFSDKAAVDFGCVFHDRINRRDTTRTSSDNQCNIPLLSERAESRNIAGMIKPRKTYTPPVFDLAKLLKAIIDNTGPGKRFTRRGLSMAATGGKNPDLIRNLLNDKSKKPSFDAVAGLATAMGLEVDDFTINPGVKGGPVYIKVVGAVEAGAWREQCQWPDEQQYEVRALQSDFPELDRFGLIVVGYSMDKLFAPGVVLDCLKLPFSGDSLIQPMPGQIVIAQHNRGDLCEMTCKRLGRDANGQWFLMPESTRPEHQDRIPIGAPDADYALDDGIVIVGIVNAAIMQFLVS